MSWHVEMVGTRTEIQTALLAKTLTNQLEYQQYICTRTAILQAMGLNGTTGVPLSVGALYVDPTQKLHLSCKGQVSNISNRANWTLQAVFADSIGQITGNPPAGTATVVVVNP